jgi:hypothetical protein
MKIIPKSPASQAGLIIQENDDIFTASKSQVECVNLIWGKAGTKVRLELVTSDGTTTNTMEITRAKFQVAKRYVFRSHDKRPDEFHQLLAGALGFNRNNARAHLGIGIKLAGQLGMTFGKLLFNEVAPGVPIRLDTPRFDLLAGGFDSLVVRIKFEQPGPGDFATAN